MRAFLIFSCLLLIAPSASPAAPQTQTDGARAYRDAIARRDVEADAVLLSAGDPLPNAAITPPPPPPTPDSGGDVDAVLVTLSVLVLIAALVAAARFGGARTASFARAPDAALRRRAAPPAPPPAAAAPDLARIAAMADRRAALEALWLAALARAAAAHDLTVGRSWTARDALRRVPSGWVHRPALARIARAAELANFGGRPVPEDQFHALLDAAAPIFSGRGA